MAVRLREHKVRKFNYMFIPFFCLGPLSLTIKLDFNMSEVTYLQIRIIVSILTLYISQIFLALIKEQVRNYKDAPQRKLVRSKWMDIGLRCFMRVYDRVL